MEKTKPNLHSMKQETSIELNELLETTASRGASDLHLVVGRKPTLRVDGVLAPLMQDQVLTPEQTETFAGMLMSENQKKRFEEKGEVDFSYSFKDKARFRVDVYRERGFIAVNLRFISAKIQTLTELNLPSSLETFTQHSQGLLLVVGPTGHGKSTTLAALLDIVNHSRNAHILTIEDPIEYLFVPDRAIITQREVREDTQTFHSALTHAFRQDPDVIMVGEMRDAETMATTISAAETGHLVFATLHTNSASQTIDRIIDSFPAVQQSQIRNQLASMLIGVISQRLVPRISGGRLPAIELLIVNHAVRNLIRENKAHQIDMVIATSFEQGMVSLDRSLVNMVKEGEISVETAQIYSLNQTEMVKLLEG